MRIHRLYSHSSLALSLVTSLLVTSLMVASTLAASVLAGAGEAGAHARPRDAVPAPRIYTGLGFDTCREPTQKALRAWWGRSPFKAVGVYIGGEGRGCSQPGLNASWVSATDRMGWRILPIFVGAQAPCISDARSKKPRIDPGEAEAEGTSDGEDAVSDAGDLGIAPGSPITLDVEAYKRSDTSCVQSVLAYTEGWSQVVRGSGYLAGFYSSANSGIVDLAAHPGLADLVWYGRWNNKASTVNERSLPSGYWSGHRRVHQYRGGAKETYGGVAMNVDRDAVDAPVALVGAGSGAGVPAASAADTGGPGDADLQQSLAAQLEEAVTRGRPGAAGRRSGRSAHATPLRAGAHRGSSRAATAHRRAPRTPARPHRRRRP